MMSGVYPRECGGTSVSTAVRNDVGGLSPRVRGNHQVHGQMISEKGSIPASAGEPCASPLEPDSAAVYPRECGGTDASLVLTLAGGGLSPRVRGNPPPVALSSCPPRSIPRECGGTPPPSSHWGRWPGLSPRVRGNPECPQRPHRRRGSIPASAGEPCPRLRRHRRGGVYPRECGGTHAPVALDAQTIGLSPRVRGNQVKCLRPIVHTRSIPRGAGEPYAQCPVCDSINGLSPRVRGNLD